MIYCVYNDCRVGQLYVSPCPPPGSLSMMLCLPQPGPGAHEALIQLHNFFLQSTQFSFSLQKYNRYSFQSWVSAVWPPAFTFILSPNFSIGDGGGLISTSHKLTIKLQVFFLSFPAMSGWPFPVINYLLCIIIYLSLLCCDGELSCSERILLTWVGRRTGWPWRSCGLGFLTALLLLLLLLILSAFGGAFSRPPFASCSSIMPLSHARIDLLFMFKMAFHDYLHLHLPLSLIALPVTLSCLAPMDPSCTLLANDLNILGLPLV